MAHQTKVQIPVAASNHSRFVLDFPHVTTSNFMEYGISFAKEYVPKSKWKLDQETFMRLEPMPIPTFGEAVVKHRAFFVPFRTVFPAFTDFSEGVPHVFNDGESAIPQYVPVIYEDTITNMFLDDELSRVVSDDSARSDFTINLSDTSDVTKYVLTPLGRQIYKMFISLGMKFTFTLYTPSAMSLLPLFCAARIYLDWFFTSQYAHTSGYAIIQKFLVRNDDVVDVGSSYMDSDDLLQFCRELVSVFYEPDYYTSAWDKPTGPNEGLQSTVTIPDIGVVSNTYRNVATTQNRVDDDSDVSADPVIRSQGLNYAANGISSYLITAVKKLGDYLKRNQLAGGRALDRFYARFGVQLPVETLNRAYFIGEFDQIIQFGDVTSMASTDSATLGDYAGKGISYGKGSFTYQGKERGYVIVISTIMPKTYYYQGIDRNVLHISQHDFFTEEFDGLGVQALSKQEVYKPIDALTDANYTPSYNNQVFGFVPRYSEYRVANAIMSGDYILRSRNVGKEAWTLFRNVRPDVDDPLDEFVHNFWFVAGLDSTQYNRIFYNTSDNVDHFNIIHKFKLTVDFPGKSLYDTYEFDDEDKSQKVTMSIGGTQLS